MKQLTIRASVLAAPHDCTLAGIVARCGGGCCRNVTYWPVRSSAQGRSGGGCENLTPTGCRWSPDERPVTCNLYPLRITPSGRGLTLHHRTRIPTSVCKGNYGQGPMLVDALRPGLVAVLGAEQYEWVRAEVVAGRDVVVELDEEIVAAIADEEAREELDLPPVERVSGRALPVLNP